MGTDQGWGEGEPMKSGQDFPLAPNHEIYVNVSCRYKFLGPILVLLSQNR